MFVRGKDSLQNINDVMMGMGADTADSTSRAGIKTLACVMYCTCVYKTQLGLVLSADEFGIRMEAFRTYLRQRPEEVLAVVTHFGVLEHMTGHRFCNCEIWSCLWEDGCCIAEHDSIQP